MRVIIIREDDFVSINNRPRLVDLTDMPTDLHAVQWDTNHGHIERPGFPNQTINSLADFQPWIDRWTAAVYTDDNPPPIPLAQIKANKNAEINAARAAINSKSFMHAGRAYACDALSRSDIDGINGYVALNGTFPPGFPGGWKSIDNIIYPLPDVNAWKAFYASMVAAGSANFTHSQLLKQALASATTAEEVAAIVW